MRVLPVHALGMLGLGLGLTLRIANYGLGLNTYDIGYVPPTDTGSLCLAVDSTHTVVGLFRSLVRRSGTHCQMNSEIRRVMSTASNSSLKQSCSAVTSVTSALEVIFNVMRSINPRFTYLLTYLLSVGLGFDAVASSLVLYSVALLTSLPFFPSVRPSVLYRCITEKRKAAAKIRISANVPLGQNNLYK